MAVFGFGWMPNNVLFVDNYEAILTSCENYIEKLLVGFYLIRKSLACLLRPPPPELSFFFFGLEDAIFLMVPIVIISIIVIIIIISIIFITMYHNFVKIKVT